MSVNAAECKSKRLKRIDHVAITREPLVIIRRGRPYSAA